MRKILAIIVFGTMLPICAEIPSYGIQAMGIWHTKGTKKGHRSEMQVGTHASWDLGGGHSTLLQLNITPIEPTVGLYYRYNFEERPIGYYNMIGMTSSGLSFGAGYDFSRNFGVQTTFTTGHNTISLGTSFTF